MIYHPSYHELAYLHPNSFTPDRGVLYKYDLEEKGYIVVRFSALKAHHDSGAKGISHELWSKIEKSFGDYKTVKSVENEETHQIDPWDIHHIMAFSKMIISDSQTMTIEGAVLGIPAIRVNTFVGQSKVIQELEEKYKLAFGILPTEEDLVLRTVRELLYSPDTDTTWAQRRELLLLDKTDLTKWMVNFFRKDLHH